MWKNLETNMKAFIWENYYQIGNQKVDLQHQELFNLANKLVQSKTQKDLAENAHDLYNHVNEHFQTEEKFMEDQHYPNYQTHVEIHHLMLAKLVKVNEKIDKHEWQHLDLLEFMREWISHILEDDAAIREYFKSKANHSHSDENQISSTPAIQHP